MKIMLKWQLHPGKLHSILDQFSKMTPEQELELGDSQVKLICRWHDLARGSGFAVVKLYRDCPEYEAAMDALARTCV